MAVDRPSEIDDFELKSMTEIDLKRIREELARLTALTAEWTALSGIAPLERDLVLEKLRGIYDMVRFAEATPASLSEVADDVPLGIDLDDVLSLGLIPDVHEAEDIEADTDEVVEEQIEQEPLCVAAPVELAVPAELPESVVAPALDPLAEVVEEPIEASSESDAEDVFEVFTEIEPASEGPTETASQSVPEATAATVEDPFFEVLPVPEPDPVPTPAPAPQPMLTSLFGADQEDDTARHRRKQRVIMSLYGSEAPALNPITAVRKTSEESVSGEVFEEFSVVTASASAMPTTEPISAYDVVPDDIAPDDETFGGEEPAPEESAELDDPTPEALPEIDNVVEPEPSVVGGVLGDVMNHKVLTLSDAYAAHPDTLSEAVHRAPVGDLRGVIGLNDRFLLIRDLFDGDAAACDEALDAFNGFENLDDCMIHIAENYSWNPDSDGAKFLLELLERKYA